MSELSAQVKESLSKERVFELLRSFVYIFCFVGILTHLCEFDNLIFESWKMRQADIAIIFFLVTLLALQKAKLFNWQSLIVTLILFPIAFFSSRVWVGSEDLLVLQILDWVIRWLAVLLITDMAITKRIRDFQKTRVWILVVFLVMTSLLLISVGNTGMTTYLYFLLFFLIPITSKEFDRFIDCILIAGFISFIVVSLISLVTNPPFGVPEAIFMMRNPGQDGRWFGYFLNIGAFGQYLGLSLALGVCSLFRIISKYRKFIPGYVLCALWIVTDLYFGELNGTRNYMVGVVFMIIALVLFCVKKDKPKHVLIKLGIFIAICVILCILAKQGIDYVYSDNYDEVAILDFLMKTPLKLVPATAGYFVKMLTRVHNQADIEEFAFAKRSVLRFINIFSSARVDIGRILLGQSTFQGTDGAGFLYGDYFVQNAHNQYVQAIYRYGFLAGGFYLLSCFAYSIMSVVDYVRSKREEFRYIIILTAMMFGIWMGEMSTIFYPMTFIPFVFLYPIFGKMEEE